jgi:hypothetical protein
VRSRIILNESHLPKIALFSPFPPQKSGIAHYTARFLPTLRKFANVQMFSSRTIDGESEYASLFRWGTFPADKRIITMGNSHFHSQGFDLMQFSKSTIICHDVSIENLLRSMSIQSPINQAPQDLTIKEIHWQGKNSLEILNVSNHNLVFHDSEIVREMNTESKSNSYFIPFMNLRDFGIEEKQPRNLLRISLFGEQNFQEKMLGMIPEISSWLEIYGVKHEFRVVGYLHPLLRIELETKFRIVENHKALTFTGYISENEYRKELTNTDVGLQMRQSNYLTLSGAASDLAVFGIRSVVPQTMKFSMQLPEYFYGLPADISPYIVAQTIINSLNYPDHLIENERIRYVELTSPENYVEQLLRVLEL